MGSEHRSVTFMVHSGSIHVSVVEVSKGLEDRH